jgi:hypothetical protein
VEETDLLVEDRLGLTTITGLLAVVASLSLGEERVLALFVLGHFVWAERHRRLVDRWKICKHKVENRAGVLRQRWSPLLCGRSLTYVSCKPSPCSLVFKGE